MATTKAAVDVKCEDTSLGLIAKGVYAGAKDHAKAREALRYYVRAWGEEGGEQPRTLRVVFYGLK